MDGSVKLMFLHRKVLYYVPLILILKCLVNKSDKCIFNDLTAGCSDDYYYQNSVLNMLRTIHEEGLHSPEQCKKYIGKMFRIKFIELSPSASDMEVCEYIIK